MNVIKKVDAATLKSPAATILNWDTSTRFPHHLNYLCKEKGDKSRLPFHPSLFSLISFPSSKWVIDHTGHLQELLWTTIFSPQFLGMKMEDYSTKMFCSSLHIQQLAGRVGSIFIQY